MQVTEVMAFQSKYSMHISYFTDLHQILGESQEFRQPSLQDQSVVSVSHVPIQTPCCPTDAEMSH